jgi:dephospho-CoA kinase
MLKVGLTGGIGSGKTYVSEIFNHLGIPVYKADNEVHKLFEKNSKIIQLYKEWFGEDIYQDGKLNKKKVAVILFQNDNLLKQINEKVHPVVLEEFNKWADENKESPYVLKEAAIIFETGANKALDFVISVLAPEELRIKRVMQRDQMDAHEVKARIMKQLSEDELIKRSDFTIVNDGKTLLLPQILEIHNKLKEQV